MSENNKGPETQCFQALVFMAGSTRLELATSGVTGQRSNQLNYDPFIWVQERVANSTQAPEGKHT